MMRVSTKTVPNDDHSKFQDPMSRYELYSHYYEENMRQNHAKVSNKELKEVPLTKRVRCFCNQLLE